MKLDILNVRYSYRDKEKGTKIPNKLTEELAEDIGMHMGDGGLSYCNKEKSSTELTHSSNIWEKDYLNFVITLKKKLYNLNKYQIKERGNERDLIYHSIAIATFYNSVFNLPIGKKVNIDIPPIIKQSKNQRIILGFIRGIVDTDFGLIIKNKYGKKYPTIEGGSISKNLIMSLSKEFSKLGIKHFVTLDKKRFDKRTNKFYIINLITISGYKRIGLFMKKIKPHNPKFLKRIKELGPKRFEFEE